MQIDQNSFSQKQVAKAIRTPLRSVGHLLETISRKKKKSIEDVHDLRTQSRRADAVIRLFVDLISHHKAKAFRKELNELRDIAGEVRDLDVMAATLKEARSSLGDDAYHWLLDRLHSKREKKFRGLRRQCTRTIDRGFRPRARSLTHGIRKLEASNEGQQPIQAIQHQIDEFSNDVNLLTEQTSSLHTTRIHARRLRYSLEAVSACVAIPAAKSNCEKLSELQDVVGQVIDKQMLLEFLDSMVPKVESGPIGTALVSEIGRLQTQIPQDSKAAAMKVGEIAAALTWSPDSDGDGQ